MGLATPATVQKLQEALHAKAKCSPDFHFYSLYDKVHRHDVLEFAYRCCQANKGCAGIDGQTFADIEAYGSERWLGELMEALRNKTYRPQPLRREYILKADGKSKRPLGIPTIRDRVAQTAAALVLGPIFEADLMPEQYAYRPGRGALDAVTIEAPANERAGRICSPKPPRHFSTLHFAGAVAGAERDAGLRSAAPAKAKIDNASGLPKSKKRGGNGKVPSRPRALTFFARSVSANPPTRV